MTTANLASEYGTINTNKIAAVTTGEIISNYTLNTTDFATAKCENGMLLMVDHYAKEVKVPAAITSKIWLVNSEVKDYENKGSKYFSIGLTDDFLPRLYKLQVGDIFETNCIVYTVETYANYDAIVAAIDSTTVYGIPDTSGRIALVATLGGSEVCTLKVLEDVTMPNGEDGLKFVVNSMSY